VPTVPGRTRSLGGDVSARKLPVVGVATFRWLSLATLAMSVLIVVTGAAIRLTGSVSAAPTGRRATGTG
jgi:hypothetical protein